MLLPMMGFFFALVVLGGLASLVVTFDPGAAHRAPFPYAFFLPACQFVSINAIALVGVFGDPGVVLGMRANHSRDQRRDYRSCPGRQLAGFQMDVNLTMLIRKCRS